MLRQPQMGTLLIRRADDNTLLRRYEHQFGPPVKLGFSPDDKTLWAAFEGETGIHVYAWPLESKDSRPVFIATP